MRTVYVGAHVSAAGGVWNAPTNAAAIGATAFALFTRNQRRWTAAPYQDVVATQFGRAMEQTGFDPAQVIPHAGYLINLGSPDDDVREKSIAALADELSRCVQLGLMMLNFHPGTSKGELDEDATCARIADGIDRVLQLVEDPRPEPVKLVLENSAGQGASIGTTIAQLALTIAKSRRPERLAICIDTCHAFAAGYDIRTAGGWDTLMHEVETQLGLGKLVAVHLNDSLGDLGSRKDRHQPIGIGAIGSAGFRAVMQDTRLDGLPLVLETPQPDHWPQEIALLKEMAGG